MQSLTGLIAPAPWRLSALHYGVVTALPALQEGLELSLASPGMTAKMLTLSTGCQLAALSG